MIKSNKSSVVMFKLRSKTLNISERDPTYKVKYIGNVLTAFMRGDGCVDRPASILWNNYLSNPDVSMDMQLTVCASGLKARTKDLGLTEYRAHRISYCVCHPLYPRLFIWVYRHDGKKMKLELRCHAVLCKSDAIAKAIAVQLHDKLSFVLSEFTREKTRRQRARLTIQRANSLPNGQVEPLNSVAAVPTVQRTKFLTVGQNFKPPSNQSVGAPKLGSITEDLEEEVIIVDDEGRGTNKTPLDRLRSSSDRGQEDARDRGTKAIAGKERRGYTGNQNNISASNSVDEDELMVDEQSCTTSIATEFVVERLRDEVESTNRGSIFSGEISGKIIDLEIGNDIETFKNDSAVQLALNPSESQHSDDAESVESGYSD